MFAANRINGVRQVLATHGRMPGVIPPSLNPAIQGVASSELSQRREHPPQCKGEMRITGAQEKRDEVSQFFRTGFITP